MILKFWKYRILFIVLFPIISFGQSQYRFDSLINTGIIYKNNREYEKAIGYHEKALLLSQEYKSNIDITISYVNLGIDYQSAGNYSKAILYAREGLQKAKEINDLKLLRESARVLFESYEVLNNYEEAYHYHVLFKQYSDSIEKISNLNALTEIQAKYNVATGEKEIIDLRTEKGKQALEIRTLREWYILAVGLFLSLSLLLFFFYYRSRISRKLSLKLKEINETKSHFFANLSHEFRTPLTLMLGPTEKLMATATPEDKPWLELIHRNASRLLFLDEQLLEFTKIDSGNQKIHLVSGDILLYLKPISESFALLAEQKNIQYSSLFPNASVDACFDPDILEKVTSNLLSNAFKYTLSGGTIEFSVSTGKWEANSGNLTPEQIEMGSFVRIDVRDTGIGIPENKQEQIFERFYQLNHNPGNTIGGVGIGLALTREMLKLHHGLITMESREGKGSLFSLFLSLNRGVFSEEELIEVKQPILPQQNVISAVNIIEPVNNPTENGTESSKIPGEFSFPQVLVVDDNADMRTYIREILHHNYSVEEAENGDRGFEAASVSIPDLIITDVMMHPMDGIEFCIKLKKDERTSHIPVIMLTALKGTQEKIMGLDTGADDYLTKPFNIRELLARTRNLISQRNDLRQLFSNEKKLDLKAISITSADEKFLQKLIRLIEVNIDNSELDTDLLLRTIAMSRSQLHRKISALTGQPITGFIRIIRIKKAAQLMEQKFGNVSDVMYAVGFNNLSYFTKSFKEVYKMTPSEFMAK
jgi:signal transduction histidine kinase/DNA-binding response OmpR family regulator